MENKKSKNLIYLIIAVVVIIIAVAAYFISNKSNNVEESYTYDKYTLTDVYKIDYDHVVSLLQEQGYLEDQVEMYFTELQTILDQMSNYETNQISELVLLLEEEKEYTETVDKFYQQMLTDHQYFIEELNILNENYSIDLTDDIERFKNEFTESIESTINEELGETTGIVNQEEYDLYQKNTLIDVYKVDYDNITSLLQQQGHSEEQINTYFSKYLEILENLDMYNTQESPKLGELLEAGDEQAAEQLTQQMIEEAQNIISQLNKLDEEYGITTDTQRFVQEFTESLEAYKENILSTL